MVQSSGGCMLEKYCKYKLDYNDYIIIIKCGSFYEVIDKDAFIINKLMDYKLKKLSNTFKAGFPINSLDNVLSLLNENSINYIIVEDKIVLKKEFDINNYSSYKFENNTIIYNSLRIERIIKYLNDNILSISDKLNKIENIINDTNN